MAARARLYTALRPDDFPDQRWLTTIGFLEKIDQNLDRALGQAGA